MNKEIVILTKNLFFADDKIIVKDLNLIIFSFQVERIIISDEVWIVHLK